MANPTAYTCSILNNISVLQQVMQEIPSGEIVSNPFIRDAPDFSYVSYNFMTSCIETITDEFNPATIYLPVCSSIAAANISVDEQINRCDVFTPVPFTFDNGPFSPSSGFRLIRIDVSGRYSFGSVAVYRVRFLGNFVSSPQPLYLVTEQGNNITYTPDPLYNSLACRQNPSLNIGNNMKILNQENVSTVFNSTEFISNAPLTNALYKQDIYYDSQVNINNIETDDSVNVDTSIPGVITLTKFFETIDPEIPQNIDCILKDISFNGPNKYDLNTFISVISDQVINTLTDRISIDVVQLTNHMKLQLENMACGVTTTIKNMSLSPLTEIEFTQLISIPPSISIVFTNFNGYNVVFSDTLKPVSLNIPITNTNLLIKGVKTIPKNSFMTIPIEFNVKEINNSLPSNDSINITLNKVILSTNNFQVFLGSSPMPLQKNLNVNLKGEYR